MSLRYLRLLRKNRLLRPVLALATAAALPNGALAETAVAPAAPSLLPMLLALAAVLALIPFAIWLLKRLGAGTAAPIAGLQVVAQLPLGTGQRIVVLATGERWLLLGVTGSAITRLGTMPKPAATDALGMVPGAVTSTTSFASLLARMSRPGGSSNG